MFSFVFCLLKQCVTSRFLNKDQRSASLTHLLIFNSAPPPRVVRGGFWNQAVHSLKSSFCPVVYLERKSLYYKTIEYLILPLSLYRDWNRPAATVST